MLTSTVPFDLVGEYHLDPNRRIATRLATPGHVEQALAYRPNPRLRLELALLQAYWPEGRTKEEAVAAYLADNPR